MATSEKSGKPKKVGRPKGSTKSTKSKPKTGAKKSGSKKKGGNFLGSIGELVAPAGWGSFATAAALVGIDQADAAFRRGKGKADKEVKSVKKMRGGEPDSVPYSLLPNRLIPKRQEFPKPAPNSSRNYNTVPRYIPRNNSLENKKFIDEFINNIQKDVKYPDKLQLERLYHVLSKLNGNERLEIKKKFHEKLFGTSGESKIKIILRRIPVKETNIFNRNDFVKELDSDFKII